MNTEEIGGVSLYRPDSPAAYTLRREAEVRFLSLIEPGVYDDRSTITNVLNRQFAFYIDEVDRLLPRLASRDFAEFALYQYDQASAILERSKAGTLSPTDRGLWGDLGPVVRRAIKYLCERMVLLSPPDVPDARRDGIQPITDRVWEAVEGAARMSLLSAQTHGVFPDETVLTVFAPDQDPTRYFDLSLARGVDLERPVRVSRDNMERAVGPVQQTPLYDHTLRARALDAAMYDAIGTTYTAAMDLLSDLVMHAEPVPDSFPVLFLRRSDAVAAAVKHKGMSPEAAERVVDGFTVSPEGLAEEGRELFRPKQSHRAFRRGFFLMPHESGLHLAFSRTMALESLRHLIVGMSFHKLPEEWSGPQSASGLQEISDEGSRWFERVVHDRLSERGFQGRAGVKALGSGEGRIRPLAQVGEIDYLGYHPGERLLLLGEAKLVEESTEPVLIRDDIAEFTRGRRAYVSKLRRKRDWIRRHWDAVCHALGDDIGVEVTPNRFATALVTFTPTVASVFIDDLPCVSLSELLAAYDAADGWPYERGMEEGSVDR